MPVRYKFLAGLLSFIYALIPQIRRPSFIGRDLEDALRNGVSNRPLDLGLLHDALVRLQRSFRHHNKDTWHISVQGTTLLIFGKPTRLWAQLLIWDPSNIRSRFAVNMYAIPRAELPPAWEPLVPGFAAHEPTDIIDYPMIEIAVEEDATTPAYLDSIMLTFGRRYNDTPVSLEDGRCVYAGDIASAVLLKRAERYASAEVLMDTAKSHGLTREDRVET